MYNYIMNVCNYILIIYIYIITSFRCIYVHICIRTYIYRYIYITRKMLFFSHTRFNEIETYSIYMYMYMRYICTTPVGVMVTRGRKK